MKKLSLLLAILLTLAIVLTGCGNASYANKDSAGRAPMAPAASVAPNEMPSMDMAESAGGIYKDGYSNSVSSGAIYENPDNKIIRTANITIQSTEFDDAVLALNQLTNQLGGYFETAEVQGGGYYNQYANRSAYYVVRVPKENFIAFRDGTSGIGHIYSINENTQDVGEAYYDTEARLQTLTTKRDRLLSLLEKADKMEDIISLENALADVQYQIDMHTSTLRKYDSLIGYSTFYIRLNEVVEIKEEPSERESFGSKFISSLKKGFKEFGEGVQNFAIWFARNLIGIIIFAAVVVVAVVVLRRIFRRRRAAKNSNQ